MLRHNIARSLVALLPPVALFLVVASALQAQQDTPGSTHLFITYRCSAANRPTFRQALQSDGIRRFEEWKRAGVISDYLLLFNQFVDANTWDAMVVLRFERYAQTARWREVEQESPGGLTQEMLKLATPETSYLADLVLSNGTQGDHSKSIFVVIPYEYRSRGEYLNYIQTYGIPQFDGWIKEGVIANYGIYLNQHAPGKPWDVLLVFEYKGIEGLAKRDLIKTKVREELAGDPSWKLLSDSKQEFRTEHEVVMANALQGNGK